MSHLPASEALSRFTVLDLTRVRAGPTCVRQLADWGADVIKIEMPERGPDGNALGGPRARLRLPEPAPQQAQPDLEPQGRGRARDLHARWPSGPTWWSRTTARTSSSAWASPTTT